VEALVELVQVIVWPAALVWLGYLFRNEIREMSKRFTWRGEREVRGRLEEALDRADEAWRSVKGHLGNQRAEPSVNASPIRYEVLQRLAQTSARATILETWVEVEAAITDAAGQYFDLHRGPMASRRVVERLIEDVRLPRETLAFYQALRDLRNSATHYPDRVLTQEDAERFLDHCLELARLVRQATS
jgi:hypothetical protein